MDDALTLSASRTFPGGGEMARAVNALDWSATPLGPMAQWAPAIRTAVSICLNSQFQIMVLPGPDLVYIYNDAAIPIFGCKHPSALGQRVADVWPEAWDAIGPVLTSVLASGRAVRQDDWQMVLNRSGYAEEAYFTLSYSPILCEAGQAVGVFVALMETSGRVLAERRQRTLGELATQVALRHAGEQTLDPVRIALAANPYDLPLTALYVATPDAGYATQVFCTGLREGCAGAPKHLAWPGADDGGHPLSPLANVSEPVLFDGAALLHPGDCLGGWPEGPRQVLALPFTAPGHAGPHAFLLVGVNPRAPLDADYRHFIDTIAGLVATAVAGVAATAAERRLERQVAVARNDLASVLERTSDAFISLDHELRVVSLNEAGAIELGAGKQDVIGRPLVELVGDLAGSTLERAMHATLAGGGPVTVEQLHATSARWFNVRCFPAPHGLIVFANEITERKQAEQVMLTAKLELERRVEVGSAELRNANELLAAVFDRAPGGIAITSTDGRFVRANPAYQALVGLTEAQLARRGIADLAIPGDYLPAAAQLEALRDGGPDSCQMQLRFRRSDGSAIWVDNFVSMIRDEQRRPRYFVHIANDITERQRGETERAAAQRELKVLYERLQTVREAERTALAREVHDQLGQILSAAKIDVKLLEDDIRLHGAALPLDKIIDELGSACATLDRAMQLVRDIATELRAPELDGLGVYAAIEWHARDFERRTRIKVDVDLAAGQPQPRPPAAEALLRIFQEAMTNVLRHAHASQVWVSVERRAGAVLLRVRDDGAGIARQWPRSAHSLGITGMRERAVLASGRLMVGPLRPRGTLVSALIPLHPAAALPAHPERTP
jgi:PAS domain S-box-containing protein